MLLSLRSIRRPACWIIGHRWGTVVRRMTVSWSKTESVQRYCERCGKPTWEERP